MKNFLFFFILSLVVIFPAFARHGEPALWNVTDLLTQSTWIGTVNFEDADGSGNFVAFGNECETDDTWIFNADGTLVQGPGAMLCNPDEEDRDMTATGNWHLEDNDEYLVIEYEMDAVKFLIVKLSEEALMLHRVDPGEPGVYRHRIVLKR